MTVVEFEGAQSPECIEVQPVIIANLTSTFTFASHQNSYPVIRSISN